MLPLPGIRVGKTKVQRLQYRDDNGRPCEQRDTMAVFVGLHRPIVWEAVAAFRKATCGMVTERARATKQRIRQFRVETPRKLFARFCLGHGCRQIGDSGERAFFAEFFRNPCSAAA